MKKYENNAQSVGELLTSAMNTSGATLLIPDIQRPYVWGPIKVTRLIDSILRGWPFGTMLLWKITEEQHSSIPKRAFYQSIDKVGAKSLHLGQAQTPNEFRLVLDGQQRLQSLLLALGSDNGGFTLLNEGWAKELSLTSKPKGGKHWTTGHLFIDLEELERQATAEMSPEIENSTGEIEENPERYLQWATSIEVGGRSDIKKGVQSDYPLLATWEHPGRFVKLSRLWKNQSTDILSPKYTIEIKKLLTEYKVEQSRQDKVLDALVAIGRRLHTFKGDQIQYLQINPRNEDEDIDLYNDAIVTIFTRLNSAGTQLTREEITFSWIKQGWGVQDAKGRSASEALEKFRADFEVALAGSEGEKIFSTDDAVQMIATMWAVEHNHGHVLNERDLLRGETVKRMAQDVRNDWEQLTGIALSGLESLDSQSLQYQLHFKSLNVLAILLAWRYVGANWVSRWSKVGDPGLAKPNEPMQDAARKKFNRKFDQHCERWLILSQWSGKWGATTNKVLSRYAEKLGELQVKLSQTESLDEALAAFDSEMNAWLVELQEPCRTYVNGLQLPRGRVGEYKLPLWVWQRLDIPRHKTSEWAVKFGKKREKLEVDHLVAVKLWQKIDIDSSIPIESLEHWINQIGNCTLLKKSFNVSKSEKEIAEFLEDVIDFSENGRQGDARFDEWANALEIQPALLRPKGNSESVQRSIEQRTMKIKGDLIQYIDGHIQRVDK
jgi:hypothetical protein